MGWPRHDGFKMGEQQTRVPQAENCSFPPCPNSLQKRIVIKEQLLSRKNLLKTRLLADVPPCPRDQRTKEQVRKRHEKICFCAFVQAGLRKNVLPASSTVLPLKKNDADNAEIVTKPVRKQATHHHRTALQRATRAWTRPRRTHTRCFKSRLKRRGAPTPRRSAALRSLCCAVRPHRPAAARTRRTACSPRWVSARCELPAPPGSVRSSALPSEGTDTQRRGKRSPGAATCCKVVARTTAPRCSASARCLKERRCYCGSRR